MPIMSALMVLVIVLGLLAPFVPFLLLAVSAPFPGDLVFAGLYSLIVCEKLYAMLVRVRTRSLFKVGRDWTSAAVGISYAAVMYATIIEFFARGEAIVLLSATVAGLGIYAAAIALRYCALHHLGHKWVVHLDRGNNEDGQLVRTGPYAFVRHPLYVGACLECIAVPLVFNSFWGLLFGLLVFAPLEAQRARFEEHFLVESFGDAYREYARDVCGFFPCFRRRKVAETQ